MTPDRQRRGRPLRFVGVLLLGWVGLRAAMLWRPGDAPLRMPVPAIALVPVAAAHAVPAPSRRAIPRLHQTARLLPPQGHRAVSLHSRYALDLPVTALAVREPSPDTPAAVPLALPPLLPGVPHLEPRSPADNAPGRWSGSAWLLARGGSGSSAAGLGGQLGGAQAGARVAFMLDRRRRVALAARIVTPLGAGLREASIGVEVQPTRLPFRLVAEQRVAIDGGHGGPGVALVGGIGPVRLPLHVSLEGYAQAGVIHRTRSEPYVDGALRIARPIGEIGALRIDLGAGAWGGAQRGAARLDVGPSLGVGFPLAKHRVRLSVDWRHRVGGTARPGSGPAVTLGSDF